MEAVYYMQTGEYGTEHGVAVKEIKKNEDDTIEVMDELGNGAGWKYSVDKKGLVSMSKEDYDNFIAWNEDPTPENINKINAKIAELVNQ